MSPDWTPQLPNSRRSPFSVLASSIPLLMCHAPVMTETNLIMIFVETCTGMTNPWSSRISGSLGFTLEAKFLYQIRFIVTTADVAFLHHLSTSCCSEVSCFLALGLDQLILRVVIRAYRLPLTGLQGVAGKHR